MLIEAQLQNAQLCFTNLAGANLRGAHLEGANLTHTDLRGKEIPLSEEHLLRQHLKGFSHKLPPANLHQVFFDSGTHLEDIKLGEPKSGYVHLADVHWNDANLSLVDWNSLKHIGEEQSIDSNLTRLEQAIAYRNIMRTYRQLSAILREQKLTEPATRFRLRQHQLERKALKAEHKWSSWFFSLILDLVAGHGERPGRTFISYIIIVATFTLLYLFLSFSDPSLSKFPWYEWIILSLTAFHGRGFFPSSLPTNRFLLIGAVIEAVIGLFIELNLVATFSRRFLSDD